MKMIINYLQGDFFFVYHFHIKPIAKLTKQNKDLFFELNLATEENIQAHIVSSYVIQGIFE